MYHSRDKKKKKHGMTCRSKLNQKGWTKKVIFDLDQLERCGFPQGVQYVAINTFVVFLNVAKFWPFLLYFMGISGAKTFRVFENGSKLILPDRTGL